MGGNGGDREAERLGGEGGGAAWYTARCSWSVRRSIPIASRRTCPPSREVRTPYPSTNRILKRCVSKPHMRDAGSSARPLSLQTAARRRGNQLKGLKDFHRVKNEQLETLQGLSPESPGHNLDLSAVYGPHSLDSGTVQVAAQPIPCSEGARNLAGRVWGGEPGLDCRTCAMFARQRK